MTKKFYFKDDHNRVVRVTVHSRGGVSLHVLIARGSENVWVPYEPTSPVHGSDLEEPFGVSELREQNVSCPSYRTE